MFFKILVNYILGYVNISVEGYFIERFINICISKNILLWNIKRKNATLIYANIGMKEFRKIKNIAKKSKCRIKIENKKGVPFLLNRYKKRKIFIFLLIIIVAFILFISNFIWNIEVIGNENISKEEIVQSLNENGLKIGVLKNRLDVKKIVSAIRLEREDISWIGIELKGTNAIVEIAEAKERPEIIDEKDYCNIVSDKDGIIVKITAQNGTALVKTGDVIKTGNILIGGWLEGKYTGTRYVHSKGEIQAKVWYSKKEKMSLIQEEYEETGTKKNVYSLNINNLKINLFKTLPNFQKYDTINENKKIKLFANLYFPIEICKTTYKELKSKEITYRPEEAKQILLEKLENELKGEIKDIKNIVNTQVNYKENDDSIEVELIYEVLENIGTEEKILF